MGIYDRDYYRTERRSFFGGGSSSVIALLIVVNVALYLADGLFTSGNQISRALRLQAGDLTIPWYWWRFVTYGFVHSPPPNFAHILFNMLGLWFLGRDVERLYGRGEFLRIYLALVIVGGLAWAVAARLSGARPDDAVLGASGAVVGTVVLFALNFPHQKVLMFPIPVPMPAWVMGLVIVGLDLYGVVAQADGPPVAYGVHLAGAAFAFFDFRLRWNFGRLGSAFSVLVPRPRARLRVHDPAPDVPEDLSQEVDRILEKISREGEASLTRHERRILENASRQYQRRRQDLDDG
jgi:membrane associated rhomboid family serine protease